MKFSELLTEFYARGFSYLNDAGPNEIRAKRWINQGYLEICEMDDWPFLSKQTTGITPLTVADMGTIEFVRGTDQNVALTPIDPRDINDIGGVPPDSGYAQYYYFDNDAISVWPPIAVPIFVRYWSVPVELSAPDDIPVIPPRYHYAIVDYACARAYMDSDNPDVSQISRSEGDRLVGLMRDRLLFRQHQEPMIQSYYGNSTDG